MIGSKKLVCLVCLLFHPTYIHPLALLINNFFCIQIRHEICQKNYTARYSGQKFYTLNFTEFQQVW